MKFHFWFRKEGDLPNDRLNPLWARLENGVIVRYHFCGRSRLRMEALLHGGTFRWQYLGEGEILDRLPALEARHV